MGLVDYLEKKGHQGWLKLVGSSRVVYTTLENTCGLIPDELRGEIFGGGRLQGNICFEIPLTEEELVLIHEPGFGAESRRYLSLLTE